MRAVDALRKKYQGKLSALEDRERRALQKVEREKAQVSDKTLSTALSVGGSLLGALFGGGRRGARSARRRPQRGREPRRQGNAPTSPRRADAAAVREQDRGPQRRVEAEVARLESELDPGDGRDRDRSR